MARETIPNSIRLQVLTEAGYRCAVPTCRNILAIDIHHIVEVSEGGGNETTNLLALCPTCHALYHRGTISKDSIRVWKNMLVVLNNAFDKETVDNLLFLEKTKKQELNVTGDGVIKFSKLVGSGLADYRLLVRNGPLVLYTVFLTPKGEQILEAWKSGQRELLEQALIL